MHDMLNCNKVQHCHCRCCAKEWPQVKPPSSSTAAAWLLNAAAPAAAAPAEHSSNTSLQLLPLLRLELLQQLPGAGPPLLAGG
jgi:hypothetical protein